MQITNTSPPGPRGESANAAPREGLSSAQMLDRLQLNEGDSRLARLLVRNGDSAQGGRALLEISGQRLPVQTDGRIPAGDLIRVLRAGNELRLMALPEPPQRSTLSQALAQKLPFQQDLQSGFNRLLQGASQPQLREALSQLLAMLPSQASLSRGGLTPTTQATGGAPLQGGNAGRDNPLTNLSGGPQNNQGSSVGIIRQWLSGSGIFSEARLATAAPGETLPPDLKQALLTAARHLLGDGRQPASATDTASQLRSLTPEASVQLQQGGQLQFPTPAPAPTAQGAGREPMGVGEALRLLAGMLNRISVNQLHSQVLSGGGGGAQEAATPAQSLLMELPWLNTQGEARTVQLRLDQRQQKQEEEEGGGEAGSQTQWRLNLALDLDGLGPLYFDLRLQQRQLDTRIWAERPVALGLVESTTEALAERLRRLELTVPPIACHLGKPVQLKTRLSQQLIDERA
ncbi:MAG: flagellar hook-length control protein FliK [Oleiphilaceae bacterium]|nr:flagellar hook-length control protein FliK [Oleiphilaceae bacterium]